MNKKIAVPVDATGNLDGHFGHCRFFEIITIDENKIVSQNKVVPPPHEPGVLPNWLAKMGTTDIIAGGMGHKAIQIFNQNNVNVFVGAPQLPAVDLAKGLLNGTIEFSANYCDH